MFFTNLKSMGFCLVLLWVFAVTAVAGPDNSPASPSNAALENQRGMKFFNHGYYDLLPRGKKEEAHKNLEMAEKAFQKAIQLDRDFLEAHRNLARLYYLQENFEQAASQYFQVLRLDPNDIDTYVQMALAQIELGNFDEAIQYLETAKDKTDDQEVIEKLDQYITKTKQAR
jgi:tetratricopeptide (TPR) repeat protein